MPALISLLLGSVPLASGFQPTGSFTPWAGAARIPQAAISPIRSNYHPNTNTWTTKAATYPDTQVNRHGLVGMERTWISQLHLIVQAPWAAGAVTHSPRVPLRSVLLKHIPIFTGADNWPGDSSGTILPGGFAPFASGLDLSTRLYILGGFDINVASTNQIWSLSQELAVGSKSDTKSEHASRNHVCAHLHYRGTASTSGADWISKVGR